MPPAPTTPAAAAESLFKSLFRARPDFTLLLPDAFLESHGQAHGLTGDWWYRYCCDRMNREPTPSAWMSFDFEVTLNYADSEPTARLQVSRCFNRQAWSLCVRWEAPADSREDPPRTRLSVAASEWKPSSKLGFARKAGDPLRVFLLSISEVVAYLDAHIWPPDSGPLAGLILITGSTNSGKSEVARGLAWKSLSRARRQPPHLVTCEGPVEKYFWRKQGFLLDTEAWPDTHQEIDYTPRQIGSDCASLEDAFTDALRQTPTVFYAGELRGPKEIKQAVEFGGTGHLAVATAHAGSLIEAMSKIFGALDARRAGTRAIHAPKLLAVVHLSAVRVKASVQGWSGNPYDTGALVPTLYRRTTLGLQSLVADGLAALLPHCPNTFEDHRYGSLGRQYFLRFLRSALPEDCDEPNDPEARTLRADWEHVREAHFRGQDAAQSIHLIDLALEDDVYVG